MDLRLNNGKYVTVTKIIKKTNIKDLTVGKIKQAYHEEEKVKYDILDGKASSKKFCEFI